MIKLQGVSDYSLSEFPDGTPNIKMTVPKGSRDVRVIWLFDNMGELFTIQAIAQKLQGLNVRRILEVPYLPNARMDREEKEENICTLKTMVQQIKNAKFHDVYLFDLHSDKFYEFFEEGEGKTSYVQENFPLYYERNKTLIKSKFDFDVIFYPDAGAKKKYTEVYTNNLDDLNVTFAHGEKVRDWDSGLIKSLKVHGNVKGKNVLIVDDICSYGGTFYQSIVELKKQGANKIALLVSHCENNILKGKLWEHKDELEYVFTTDSIFTESDEKIILFETWRKR